MLRSRGSATAKAAIACVVAVVSVLVAAEPAGSTTGVDPLVYVAVRITDTRIVVTPNHLLRSQVVDFRVVNVGKKTHDFRISGQKTRPLRHGDVDHVIMQFFDPGNYPYVCKLHCTAKMRGYLVVRDV